MLVWHLTADDSSHSLLASELVADAGEDERDGIESPHGLG